ncbi:MAG: ribose-phosphate pyrophosphokinase [Verrucomicrobiales bacterium]|jgi:ribose-phosphate pyrophosphokinase
MELENSNIKILSGSAHPTLCDRICTYLGVQRTNAEVTSFPDGETFVKINENIRGSDVYIFQPTCPPTNHNLMELFIMADAARRASAERITAVIPFFGYARQDRKDQPRVPITAKLVANLLVASGVRRVLTMDLHAGQIQGFFDIPVDHLYAKPAVISYLKGQDFDPNDWVVVSPDVGNMKMTHSYAKTLGTSLAIVAKNRVSATEVEAIDLIGEVEGKNTLIIDDMTETFGTIQTAANLLKKRGAKTIRAVVSHAVLAELGQKRLAESPVDELIATDSTPFAKGEKVTVLGIDELMGEGIRRIHENKSVTSLFDIQ